MRGALLVNPGGPGGSGLDFLRWWAPSVTGDVRNRFDLVSFDPRGVGRSSALVCYGDTKRIQRLAALDPIPDTPAEWRGVQDEARSFAAACEMNGRELLPYLGTVNVVRDLDRIREALGEDKLTYLGYSYGTVIGAVYADTYPARVRALVLDGAVDMSLTGDELSLEQAQGFDGAMERFISDCRVRKCLPESLGDPGTAVDELVERAEASPIPAPKADRPAGPGETLGALLGALYSQSWWPDLENAIEHGLRGDGSDLVRLFDAFLQRRSDGSYDNGIDVYNAVTCLDYAFSRDPAHYQALIPRFEAKARRFGSTLTVGELPCAYWPVDASPLQTPRGKGAPPILVIGTTGDPATPYQWAVAMSQQLESATLLTFNGEGHTAYRNGNRCIDEAVNAYLLTLKLPARNTRCGDPARAEPIKIN
jgi:pimeloyl-ACP methyl ester carboxylesterase